MAYTNVEDVKSIMDDSMNLDDPTIQKYIMSANVFLEAIYADDTSLSTDLRTEIERWYTAHLITVTQFRTTVKEEMGDAALTFSDSYVKGGLNASPYGQVVLQLDTTGLIVKSTKRQASIYAIKSFDE